MNIDKLKENWKGILIGVLILLIICIGLYEYESKHQVELGKAVQLSQTQMENINSLQNELSISKENAEGLKAAFNKVQAGQLKPVTNITVAAPSVPVAAQLVQERINKNDTTLPPQTLEKTDRTVVVQQPENKDYQVGVYKANLDKPNEVGLGIGIINGKALLATSVQRDKIEAIVYTKDFKTVDGATIIYKKRF